MDCADFAAGRCRSCSELALPYAEQIARKQAEARQALSDWAPNWLSPLTSAEHGFRNKAKLAVGGTLEAPTLGILDPGGAGVDLPDCPLYPASLRAAFASLRAWLIAARVPPYQLTTRSGEAKYLLLTEAPGSGDLMLRVVLRSREAIDRLRLALPALCTALPALRAVSVNLLPEHKAVTEGEIEMPLWGEASITAWLNGIPLVLRPRSFFQTHSDLAAALYRQAQAYVGSTGGLLWDLYCGVGGFALHLASPERRVVGVESTAEAIDSARQSADQLGLVQAQFVCADATQWARAQAERPDIVVVNPPRRGIGADLARWLNTSGAGQIVYSSCLMESLRRDLTLLDRYAVREARILDLFPHTRHYETIVHLSLRSDCQT